MTIDALPYVERLVVAELIHPSTTFFLRRETKKMFVEHWNALPHDCRITVTKAWGTIRLAKVRGEWWKVEIVKVKEKVTA